MPNRRLQLDFSAVAALCFALGACVDPSGTDGTSTGAAGSRGSGGGTSSSGGTGGGGSTAGTDGAGGGGMGGDSVGFEGSYDLEFRNVVAQRSLPGPPWPNMPSPSEGAKARVDIRRIGAAYDALVTPRWGTPAGYAVKSEGGMLILTGGSAVVQKKGLFVTEKWTELRLLAHPLFGLTGGVTASGDVTIVTGDVVHTGELTADGTLQKDRTPPEVAFELASPILPEIKLLPWETFAVRMAEGVELFPLSIGLSLRRLGSASNAPMPEAEWIFEPRDPTGWAGVIKAVGRTKSWDGINGVRLDVSVAGVTVIDLSGHTMGPLGLEAGFTVLDVNLAVPGYPLDPDPSPRPAQWGDVVMRGTTAPDPLCESGACAVFGPYENKECSVGRRGLAGKLNAPAGRASVRVRYRVLAASELGTPPTFSPPPFSIDVAALGIDPRTTEVTLPTLTDLGAGAGEFRYASEFLDAVAPGPDVEATELGFAIYGGTRSTIACSPGGLARPSVKMQLVIDKIAIEPR